MQKYMEKKIGNFGKYTILIIILKNKHKLKINSLKIKAKKIWVIKVKKLLFVKTYK